MCLRGPAHTFLSVWAVRRSSGRTENLREAVGIHRWTPEQGRRWSTTTGRSSIIFPESKKKTRICFVDNLFETSWELCFLRHTWSFPSDSTLSKHPVLLFLLRRPLIKTTEKPRQKTTESVCGGQHGDPGRYRAVSALGPEPEWAVRGRRDRVGALHQRKWSIRDGWLGHRKWPLIGGDNHLHLTLIWSCSWPQAGALRVVSVCVSVCVCACVWYPALHSRPEPWGPACCAGFYWLTCENKLIVNKLINILRSMYYC